MPSGLSLSKRTAGWVPLLKVVLITSIHHSPATSMLIYKHRLSILMSCLVMLTNLTWLPELGAIERTLSVKNMSSLIANGIRRAFTHDGMDDTGCPLKIIKTEYARRIPMFKGLHRFLPAMVLLQNGKIKQVSVQHFPRIAGKSKYNLWIVFGSVGRLLCLFMDEKIILTTK